MIPITKEGKLLGWYIKLPAEQFLLLDPEMNVEKTNIERERSKNKPKGKKIKGKRR